MRFFAVLVLCLTALPAGAQEAGAVYQEEKKGPLRFTGDALAREEWTRDIFVTATQFRNEDRWRLQFRPALEASVSRFTFGVGADLNYSQDDNFDPDRPPALLRDNYDSRDARVALAFARFDASWIKVEGGRIVLPVELTEMLWDKDLRPQGGALTLAVHDRGSLKSFGVTGLYAKGSHVFEDQTETLLVSAEAVLRSAESATVQVIASYLDFRNTDSLAPFLRRQNTRVSAGGLVKGPFHVVDGVLRLRKGGPLPWQLVADYCWNTALDDDNQGLWLAAVLGATETRARLDYTFAKVDKDATLAAYPADDFLWETGWLGHRGDLGFRLPWKLRIHGIGEWLRFKDSPRPEERDHWVKRYRLEVRLKV
jgi:hypothetical protein